MPYKDKTVRKWYWEQWYQEHKEDIAWKNTLWREENQDRKNELDRKSWNKHSDYYNCVRRLNRKLIKMSDNILYIKIVDIERCKGCNRKFFKNHRAQKYCTKSCAKTSRLLTNKKGDEIEWTI